MKNKYVILGLIVIFILSTNYTFAEPLAQKAKGLIFLQVESKGEAWYVNPTDSKRYSLGKPSEAFEVMRQKGIGITNNDLKKIPVAVLPLVGADQDGDQLSDMLETAIGTNPTMADSDMDGFLDNIELANGYNPLGSGKLIADASFSAKQKGKILLQVEGKGEAWYVNPKNNTRYFLGRADDAFNIMRQLGVGITNTNLNSISTGISAPVSVTQEGIWVPDPTPIPIPVPDPTPIPTPVPTPSAALIEVCTNVAKADSFMERYFSSGEIYTNIEESCESQNSSLSEPLKTLKSATICPYTEIRDNLILQQQIQENYDEIYSECLAEVTNTNLEQELAQCKLDISDTIIELNNVACDDNDLETYSFCFNETKGQQLGLSVAEINTWREAKSYLGESFYSFVLASCLDI